VRANERAWLQADVGGAQLLGESGRLTPPAETFVLVHNEDDREPGGTRLPGAGLAPFGPGGVLAEIGAQFLVRLNGFPVSGECAGGPSRAASGGGALLLLAQDARRALRRPAGPTG
jgi:hypothetical protein